MLFDDRPGDRETEAGSFTGWFRGKKWVEDHFDGRLPAALFIFSQERPPSPADFDHVYSTI